MSGERVAAFVRLLSEGTEVYRPVQVEALPMGDFRLLGPDVEGEHWEFAAGEIVRLTDHTSFNGQNIKLVVAASQARSA
jgi:hypothetical protein